VTIAVGFLGAGQMATALARGWQAQGLLDPARSLATDRLAAARTQFQNSTKLRCVETLPELLPSVDVVLLAVKPQSLPELYAELRSHLEDRHLVVSIAAGVTLAQLAAGLGDEVRLVRVMPNTPALVGAGAAGLTAGPAATSADADLVERMFAAVGVARRVSEPLLDAVTGLSGSGPAYAFVLIEALADGGVRAGLPRDTALALAAQTLLGSARMVLETGQHPAALKDAVASPGGTTIAGLHALEQAGFRAAAMDAVLAAARRAQELGQR
jgi:pyrroline-5-carboxylate reductase